MTDGALGRRERKKEETKRRIFLSALDLFGEKGFQATTVDEICERADVAKGTFFNYFPRKEAVVEYLAEEWMDVAEDLAQAPKSATERLLALYQQASRAYEEHPDLARLVVRTAMERFCCPAPGGAWQRFDELVLRVIEEGQSRGEIRRDRDPYVVYGVLGSCFLGALVWSLGRRDESTPPELRDLGLVQAVEAWQLAAMGGFRVAEANKTTRR